MVGQGPHQRRLKTSLSKKVTFSTSSYFESIFRRLGAKIIKIAICIKYSIDYG